ncbi:MAG: alpha/beta hydrolase-fold protein [Kiritimatiellaeota bacterium]|nr:alpha/beta hydrolase-fold protein [Kiritimatiellota bacterium]
MKIHKGIWVVALVALTARAQDWSGPFQLIPMSAPEMVLESVAPGNVEGAVVSINKPANSDNQIWIVARKESETYAFCNKANPLLVLAAKNGGTNSGTQMVLEADAGKLWQRWTITNLANGAVALLSGHVPTKGLDDQGGRDTPGAKQDLWEFHPHDEHLQWVLKPLAGATVQAAVAAGPHLDPLAPKGTIKEFTFTDSKIFPGTKRAGHVFIPAQYDAKKPACVYVRQDGYNTGEKKFLESLISVGDMPVTVGVFVRPGEVPAPMKGTLGRRNRCFEYDAVNDNYARFLVEELLPFIAKEFNLNLSTNGNDRCIAGGSSGGIAAFNAAWQRPDAFTRVYANSGSFVAFRGGHEFPTMVRKFEPKPIRAYLTTGTHDMINCAGDWYLLDQEMDKALGFSGYDYFFRAIEGRHVAGWMENFPEAMRFIWKGWPEPVKAGAGAPRVQDVLVSNETWSVVAEGFESTRGPACNAKGEVFFADTSNNKLHCIGLDGKVSTFVADAGQAHCVTVGADGKVYTISEKSGKLMCYDAAGNGSVVMDGLLGHSILARPDGGLYVTSNGEKPNEPGKVWFIKDGQKTLVDSGLKFATGMAVRPDQWLLSVADGHSKWIYSYQMEADGKLTNKERFFHLFVSDWDDDAGAECVCYSLEGRQFIATRSGVQVSADDGPTQVILPVPDRSRVTGVCLGGSDGNTLFAFCGNKIWKRTIKQHAMGAFTPWRAVRGTSL